MINLLTIIIKKQEQVIAQFRKDRTIWIDPILGTQKINTLTIDFAEAVAIYELQGMKRVLTKYNEQLKGE